MNIRQKRKTRGMSKSIPTNWVAPLDLYASHLRAAGFSEQTVDRRLTDIEQIAREVGPEGPESITGEMLVSWAGQKDWAQETRRGRRASARSFWKWAIAAGVCSENAAEAWPYVTPAQARPRPVPDRILLPALAAANPREKVMLRLAAEMGLRRGEIAVVHIGRDLHMDDRGRWRLIVHGKGDRERILPVPDTIAALLRAGAPGHSPGMGYSRTGYLFPGDIDGHLSPRWVGTVCKRLLQAQQEEGEIPWTLHKGRHRFGSRALRKTKNLLAVRDALGHVSVATTQIYCAVDDDDLTEVMNSAA